MPRQRELMLGRRDEFAVKVAFLPDPDEGRASSAEHSVSWGSLEIWLNGHNVCSHVECGEPVESVHWYLLPILQWLASNWDFILHEERLPAKNAGRDAWLSMLRTADSPPALSEDAAEQWESQWHSWWARHCILACREGGLLPNLFIRRWRDSIEFSWGHRPIAGAPEQFRFDATHGSTRRDPTEVADVLFGILDGASSHLQNEMPQSPIIRGLVENVAGLEATDNRRRLGLLSGYRSNNVDAMDRWSELLSVFPKDLPGDVNDAIFRTYAAALVIRGSCQAALMFGSLSPCIAAADAQLLAGKLVHYYDPSGESTTLHQLVRNEPVERNYEEAWTQGYRLADGLHEALGDRFATGPIVDIEAIYNHLGISVDEVDLQDASIRAVAIAGEHHKPAVLINRNYEYLHAEPRRFTLGHELCHILHDRAYGAQLAMASGPWAPIDIEKRANAFAAMLLMPVELIEAVVRGMDVPLDSAPAIWQVANALRTSFSATLEHLCNLGFVDELTRESLRAAMETQAAKTSGNGI